MRVVVIVRSVSLVAGSVDANVGVVAILFVVIVVVVTGSGSVIVSVVVVLVLVDACVGGGAFCDVFELSSASESWSELELEELEELLSTSYVPATSDIYFLARAPACSISFAR